MEQGAEGIASPGESSSQECMAARRSQEARICVLVFRKEMVDTGGQRVVRNQQSSVLPIIRAAAHSMSTM